MSLHSTEVSAPSIFDYKLRERIPEDEQCNICDGLGKYLYAHLLRGGNLYEHCTKCHGTGCAVFPKQKPTL